MTQSPSQSKNAQISQYLTKKVEKKTPQQARKEQTERRITCEPGRETSSMSQAEFLNDSQGDLNNSPKLVNQNEFKIKHDISQVIQEKSIENEDQSNNQSNSQNLSNAENYNKFKTLIATEETPK